MIYIPVYISATVFYIIFDLSLYILPLFMSYPFNVIHVHCIVLSFDRAIPLGPDQLLLRGAMLRNTKWIFGEILFSTFKKIFSHIHNK